MLPIRATHAVTLAGLPPGHGDAFDRLIVAQAIAEPLRLLTTNAELGRYTSLVDVVSA